MNRSKQNPKLAPIVRDLLSKEPSLGTFDLYERIKEFFPGCSPTWLRSRISNARCIVNRTRE